MFNDSLGGGFIGGGGGHTILIHNITNTSTFCVCSFVWWVENIVVTHNMP